MADNVTFRVATCFVDIVVWFETLDLEEVFSAALKLAPIVQGA
jgi:hypothetical protein